MKRLASFVCAALALTVGAPALADPPRGRVDASALPTMTHAPAAAAASPVASPVATAGVDGVVNLNAASEDELVRVPGIGPARASAITSLRARVQRFRHIDDLLRVRGIGRVTLRAMRPYLTLTGDTTLQTRPRRPRVQ